MTRPKFGASLTFVPPVPKRVRLKTLKNSPRISMRAPRSPNSEKSFATEMFSFRFGNSRTFGLKRVELPRPRIAVWLGNFEMSWNRSTFGSKSPFCQLG